MIVQSYRLGRLEIPDHLVITMAKPVLGFERLKRFCLIEVEELAPFLWWQSIEDPAVAFLVVNPRVFVADYHIEVNSREIAELEVEQAEDVETYVVVTIPEDISRVTLNLQGPLLVNSKTRSAKQLVLVNTDYQMQFRLMTAGRYQDVAQEVETELAGV